VPQSGVGEERRIAAEGRGYGWTDQALCPAHTDDPVLNAVITANLSETACSYCPTTGGDEETPIAAPLDTFLEAFMAGVHFLYEPAEDSGVPVAEGDWITTVYDVIDTNVRASRSASSPAPCALFTRARARSAATRCQPVATATASSAQERAVMRSPPASAASTALNARIAAVASGWARSRFSLL
jgi:hypothetical protein